MKNKKSNREIQRFNQSVIHNFDVSVIMSFYKQHDEFSCILPRNAQYLQRNGIEVIIVMDEPTEQKKMLNLIKQYPFINWKLIVNEREHSSRNRARSLNVGIKHATKKYILQVDPEVEYYTDIILQMRQLLEYYPRHYALASRAYVSSDLEISNKNIDLFPFMFCGNIMVQRRYLEQLNGYDESFLKWGGENDNLRARLNQIGLKKLILPEAKTLHRKKEINLFWRKEEEKRHSNSEFRKMFYPQESLANNSSWGEEFDTTIYNWKNNRYAEELCINYFNDFLQHEIKDSSIFQKKYKKLILCQAYNESEFMSGFLENMDKYFDGIILLDDESTDNTWELASHEKLLLKVKKRRTCFNDLENRNILLNIASFFQSEWFCFMDIDERIDERFDNFNAFENDTTIDVVVYNEVFLWGNEHTYKGGIPYSHKGIRKIARMFRNMGHASINTLKKKLHFMTCPCFKNNIFYSKILLKDYGSLTKSKRVKKYKMYLEEDKYWDLPDYDYLLDLQTELYELNKIELQ